MKGFRFVLEWGWPVYGLAFWVPWRHPSRPLIYAFWRRWNRIF